MLKEKANSNNTVSKKDKSSKVNTNKRNKYVNWIKGILVVLIFICLWVVNWHLFPEMSITERGAFGDKFGVVGSLFSGLALAGIIISLYFQNQELSNSRNQSDEQLQLIREQSFESSFFNLFGAYREIVNQVEYECSEGHFKGRIAFKHYYQNLKNDNKLVDIENLSMPELTHYFYNIYNIVKWVDTNYALLKKDNKSYQYIRLIRGVLSQYELYLLFYFGLTKDGKKLEYFINKYTLFKYLPSDFNKSECVGKYINRAFKYKKDDDEWQEYQTMHDQ